MIDFYGEITTFYRSNTNPRFPPFLLSVRCKSGVTFVRRCFRDGRVIVMAQSGSIKHRAAKIHDVSHIHTHMLQVYDDNTSYGIYCGRFYREVIKSRTETLYVLFVTDNTVIGSGFTVIYTTVESRYQRLMIENTKNI